jgi:glycerol kinase
MSLGSQIAANLPYLRRFARALTGSQATGDAFVRAMLEAVAYQTMDVVDAMEKDSGVKCCTMKVHRGMTANEIPPPDVC